MSTIDEEVRACKNAEKLLCELADGTIKRIPKAVRERARAILRHMPGPVRFEMWEDHLYVAPALIAEERLRSGRSLSDLRSGKGKQDAAKNSD